MCYLSRIYGFSIDLHWAQGVLGKVLAWPGCLDVKKLSPVPLFPKEMMSWDVLGWCARMYWDQLAHGGVSKGELGCACMYWDVLGSSWHMLGGAGTW